MKQIIFTAILILVFCFAIHAQKENKSNMPIVDPDIFGKMNWKEGRLKLDDFSNQLNQNKDKIGFIVIDFGKNVTEAKRRSRLKRITYYLVKAKKIEKNRFNLLTSSVYDTETTKYLIVGKSEIPKN